MILLNLVTTSYNLLQPFDRFFPVLFEVRVGLTEMFTAEKAVMRGEWGRVRRFEHEMFLKINELAFLSRVITPQQENQSFFFVG